jgi:hypothetical protein
MIPSRFKDNPRRGPYRAPARALSAARVSIHLALLIAHSATIVGSI